MQLTPEFPVLSFSGDVVEVKKALSELSTCTKLGLKSGFYSQLKLVDRTGKVVTVRKVTKLNLVFPTTFRQFLGFIEANPEYRVALDFEMNVSIPFEELRDMIFTSFRRDPSYWNEMIDFDSFRDQVEKAGSFDQVFEMFEHYHL